MGFNYENRQSVDSYFIENVMNFPRIKNRSDLFAGWCGSPKLRPLVLVNTPNFKDPEKWKPFKPSSSYKKLLYKKFRAIVGDKAIKCIEYSWTKVEPYNFKPEELLLYKSYRSKTGEELVPISLDKDKIACELMYESEWSINWFVIYKDDIKHLGHDLNLVDAGDYDNDGNSEIIFWYSGYNRDGYIIYYDDFKQSAKYIWSYH